MSASNTEKLRYQNEEGVVRNEQGRILATGWPFVPVDKWPIAHAELAEMLQRQSRMEEMLIEKGRMDALGRIHFGNNGLFNISGITLRDHLVAGISEHMNNPYMEDNEIRVCDLGGGDGNLLANTMWKFRRSKYALPNPYGRAVRTTLTSLTDFGVAYEHRGMIDETYYTGVELPPDEFYEAFNVVTAQDSVCFWSVYPELASMNIYKMLKPNGMAIVTVPTGPIEVYGDQTFDMIAHLQTCGYLIPESAEPISGTDGYIVKLRKS